MPLTFGDILTNYGHILKGLNRSLFDESHIITLDDYESDVICGKYDKNSFNVFSNQGLFYDGKNILFLHNKLDGIKIKVSKDIVDCFGNNLTVECIAIVNVYNGVDIYDTIEHRINPLYSFVNCEFNFVTNTVKIPENHSYSEKKITIEAKYGYQGHLYKDVKEIIQEPNSTSEWIANDEELKDIIVEANTQEIPSKGGIANITVKKLVESSLCKKDKFGNVSNEKKITSNVIDATDESIIIANESFVSTRGNSVIFRPQETNSKERYATITCKYKSLSKSLKIAQDKGSEVSYSTIFSFDNGKEEKVINLENCLQQSRNISIINSKIRLLDGVEYDRIDITDISIQSDSDWLTYSFDYDSMVLSIYSDKNSSDSLRYGSISLTSNGKTIISSVTQPSRKQISLKYSILIVSNEELSESNINDYKIEYKPLKRLYFDDGSEETFEVLEPFYKLDVDIESTNKECLTVSKPKLIDFNGKHTSRLIYNDDGKYDDVKINLSCRILDSNSIRVSDMCEKEIVLHRTEPNKKNMEITISIENSSDYKEISSLNNPLFKVLDRFNNIIYEANISRFWLNNSMKSDIVYKGKIPLYETKEYQFIVGEYICKETTTKQLNEKYLIEIDDLGIDLCIKL